jgi:hypothetical protein
MPLRNKPFKGSGLRTVLMKISRRKRLSQWSHLAPPHVATIGAAALATIPQPTSPTMVSAVPASKANLGTRIDSLNDFILGCRVLFAVYAKADELAGQAGWRK